MPYWRWPQQINYNRNEYKLTFFIKIYGFFPTKSTLDMILVRFDFKKIQTMGRAGVIRHAFPMRKNLGPGNRTDRNGIGWYYL